MIMNDTCATHRSRVPRRSFGRNKRRSDDIGRRERTRPGFYFMFCVWQSSVRGCRFSVMFVYFVIKMFKCSPVPASFFPYITNFITLVPKPGRKEGHAVREPSLLSGIAVLRRSGSRKWRRPPVAARSGGAGAKEEQVGRKTRCRAPGTRRGGCRPRGSGGVAPFAWRPKPAAIRHVWGGAGNGGLAAGCPRPEEPPPSARRRMSIGPSTKEVQYHRMAPRVNRSAG